MSTGHSLILVSPDTRTIVTEDGRVYAGNWPMGSPFDDSRSWVLLLEAAESEKLVVHGHTWRWCRTLSDLESRVVQLIWEKTHGES